MLPPGDQADESRHHLAASSSWGLAVVLLLALAALAALVISHPMEEHEVSHFEMDLEYQTVFTNASPWR